MHLVQFTHSQRSCQEFLENWKASPSNFQFLTWKNKPDLKVNNSQPLIFISNLLEFGKDSLFVMLPLCIHGTAFCYLLSISVSHSSEEQVLRFPLVLITSMENFLQNRVCMFNVMYKNCCFHLQDFFGITDDL